MIPPLAVDIVTVAVFFVGFLFGWWWRGRRDRELAAEVLGEIPGKDGRD